MSVRVSVVSPDLKVVSKSEAEKVMGDIANIAEKSKEYQDVLSALSPK